MRLPFLPFLLFLMVGVPAWSGDSPITTEARAAEVMALAKADLRAGDNDADRNISAALRLTELLAYRQERSEIEQVTEIQALIYWCRKRMDADTLQRYVAAKGGNAASLAKRMDAVVSTAVPADQVGAWFARTETWAAAHPEDQLTIAIRWFEVADRFAGQPKAMEAQRRSLDALKKSNTGSATAAAPEDRVAAVLKAQLSVPAELPESAKAIITASNQAVAKITASASEQIEAERRKTAAIFASDIEAARKKGDLDAVLALQKQSENLEQLLLDRNARVKYVIENYAKAKDLIFVQATNGVNAERQKLKTALTNAQAEETKRDNLAGALAIKRHIEGLPGLSASTTKPQNNAIEILPISRMPTSARQLRELADEVEATGMQAWYDGNLQTDRPVPKGGTCEIRILAPVVQRRVGMLRYSEAGPSPLKASRLYLVARQRAAADEVILRGVIAINRGASVEFTNWNAKVGNEVSVLSVTLNQVVSITSLAIRNADGQTFGIAEVYYE
ncbi:hypothetical protein LBMAG53_22060 [Planctomycetota bacterium]|nr:hypothetical protein LBMAG53_22060 [Planctomycetota bacterium]